MTLTPRSIITSSAAAVVESRTCISRPWTTRWTRRDPDYAVRKSSPARFSFGASVNSAAIAADSRDDAIPRISSISMAHLQLAERRRASVRRLRRLPVGAGRRREGSIWFVARLPGVIHARARSWTPNATKRSAGPGAALRSRSCVIVLGASSSHISQHSRGAGMWTTQRRRPCSTRTPAGEPSRRATPLSSALTPWRQRSRRGKETSRARSQQANHEGACGHSE